ncbi:MAG: amidohydrolase [Solobacterium sp.]|nr:amidohydrolase [Solobacterium sp.]
MRKLIKNAKIYQSDADSIVIEDGIIQEIFKGSKEDEYDEVIDIKGSLILPGFIDSHLHLLNLGYYLSHVSLIGLPDLGTLLDTVKTNLKEGQWFYARGFNESTFKEPILPTKEMLDKISTDTPISLSRACGHMMVVNSKVLQLCGITKDEEQDGGRIDFENGFVYEHAIEEIKAYMPKPTRDDLYDYVNQAMKYLNQYGITSVGSDDFISVTENWELPLDVFLRQSHKQHMTVRMSEQCEFTSLEDFAKFLDEGYTTGMGNEQFQIGPLKMILDGSLGARTAYLSKPYEDETGMRGMLCYSEEEYKKYVALANHYNMPTITHAIGDQTVDIVLDTYEDYMLEGNPLGYGLVHCQIMRQDQIDKVVQRGIHCFIQSLFINGDSVFYEKRVGDTAKTSYPFGSLYRGTPTGNGSDAPVEIPDVLKGIYLAVTRKSIDYEAKMDPSECLTIEEAIDSYTEDASRVIGRKEDLGRIAPGYRADFVVLDKNLYEIEPEEILKTKVLLTIFDGDIVYQA